MELLKGDITLANGLKEEYQSTFLL